MDHRDLAAARGKWYKELNHRNMTARTEIYDENDDEIEVWVPFVWAVCPTCNGKGTHVNPSIDAHGISPEEFAEDPDFHDDYLRGSYDVPCYECQGRTTVPEPDEQSTDKQILEQIREQEADDVEYARMCDLERRMGC